MAYGFPSFLNELVADPEAVSDLHQIRNHRGRFELEMRDLCGWRTIHRIEQGVAWGGTRDQAGQVSAYSAVRHLACLPRGAR